MDNLGTVDKVYTAADGTVYGTTYNTAYGKVYIPEGADSSTPMCGNFMGDINLSLEARDNAASSGCQTILFFGDKTQTQALVNNMNSFSQATGLGDTNQVSFMGGSAGGGAAIIASSQAINSGMTVTSCTSIANWRGSSSVTDNLSNEQLQAILKNLKDNDVPLFVGYYDTGSLANAEYIPSLYASMGGNAQGFKLEYTHDGQVMGTYSAGFIDILNGDKDFDSMAVFVDPKGTNPNRYIIFNKDGTVRYNVSETEFVELFGDVVISGGSYSYLSGLSSFDGTVCNETEICNGLNAIRKAISSTSFLTSPFEVTATSTTQIPSQEDDKLKEITDLIAKVYKKLSNDTEEIAFMANLYKMEDAEFSKYANEINDALKAAQEAASSSSGSSGYYGGGSSGGYSGGSYAGGYASGATTQTTPTEEETNITNEDKEEDKTNDNNEEKTEEENTEDLSDLETTEFDDYWPDYDTLTSDEEKLVYNCDDEFKLIVHTNDNEVTGLEHMFKFANEDAALEGLEKIKQDYKDVDNVDKIILNDNFIKVLFNKLAFKDLTREDAKSMYEHLGEITSTENN